MENKLSVQPYKGTRDFYPQDMHYRNWYFKVVRSVIESYGFEEYHTPLLESYDIYAAKSGEEIAGEQLFVFEDKKNRKVAIRPEMTPSAARMVAAKMESLTPPLRWYSVANFMRYEKPQKGRLREHWQVNVDIFGADVIEADLEIISVIVDILKAFGADHTCFKIKLNNRRFFNDVLKYIFKIKDESVRLVSKAVDKKTKIPDDKYKEWLKEIGLTQENIILLQKIFSSTFEEIVKIMNTDSDGTRELNELFCLLKETGLDKYCEFDFSIVRGFDYYTGTVFEVYDTSPENKRSLFGGGRYDDLVGMFKDLALSGIGFGLGDVTFQHFLEIHSLIPEQLNIKPLVLITRFQDVPLKEYFKISSLLRENNIRNFIYFSPEDKLGKQLKFAEKKGASLAIVLGADELAEKEISIKDLKNRKQIKIRQDELISKLKEFL